MARRKAPAQAAPKTLPEAVALLSRFSAIAAEIEAAELARDAAIAAINAAADETIAPAEAELKDLFRMLKPWWSVACDELTEGKRKSIELGGCLIGHRMSNPKLEYAGNEATAIGRLKLAGAAAAVRTKETLDKEQLLGLLKGPPGYILPFWGFASAQREEFFIDRLPPKAPAVETVPDTEVAA